MKYLVAVVLVTAGLVFLVEDAWSCKHHHPQRVHHCRVVRPGLVSCPSPAPVAPLAAVVPTVPVAPVPVVPPAAPAPESLIETDKEYEEATEEIPSCTPPDCEEQTPPVVEVE